jgi:hypothetical protein
MMYIPRNPFTTMSFGRILNELQERRERARRSGMPVKEAIQRLRWWYEETMRVYGENRDELVDDPSENEKFSFFFHVNCMYTVWYPRDMGLITESGE